VVPAPEGPTGEHGFELDSSGGWLVLRHALRGRTAGRLRWQWPLLMFEPLHDALIED